MDNDALKKEKTTNNSNDKKALRIALCIIAALLILQTGFYVVVFITRKNNQGSYAKQRRGIITPIAKSAPCTDEKIDIQGFSLAQVYRYFCEIALFDESHEYENTIRKWTSPVRFFAEGEIDTLTEEVLLDLFEKMNSVKGFPGIFRVYNKEDATLIGYFLNDEDFLTLSHEYGGDENTYGITLIELDEKDYSIHNGLMMVRNEMSEIRRRSVISEELIQSMGLANDSYVYPESLFYQGYNEVPCPNDLDWILFRILYHPLIQPGMNYDQIFPMLITILIP